ncbi:MAG: DUF1453 domain-containing protein [Chthoniobacterales bacterium]
MPLIPLVLALLLPVILVLALPFSLIQRYRIGTARRLGRRWVATINLLTLVFSVALFVWAAALTNFWVPKAFIYSLVGLACGSLLGLLGVGLTRWEQTSRALFYTPNRWLILVITLAVTARLLYGSWRAWHAWGATGSGTSWLAASGLAGSMAVGAVVLGYYLVYSAGVWRRLRRHESNHRR